MPIRDAAWWLEFHLETWARWMRSDERPAGLPEKASGRLENFTTMYGDSDLEYDRLDNSNAEATNAAIDGLQSPAERCLIYCHYGVAAVFRFGNIDRDAVLLRAKHNVQKSLERRGIWMGE